MQTAKQTPVKVQEKHVFSTEEREDYLAQLLQAMAQKGEIEAEFKASKATFKSKIDQKDSDIKLTQNLLTSGFEYRPVMCYIVKNFDGGRKEYFEVGTDRLVQSEPLSAKDYQLDLEETESNIQANNKKADQLQVVIDEKVEDAGAIVESFDENPFNDTDIIPSSPMEDEGSGFTPEREAKINYGVEESEKDPFDFGDKDEDDFDFDI